MSHEDRPHDLSEILRQVDVDLPEAPFLRTDPRHPADRSDEATRKQAIIDLCTRVFDWRGHHKDDPLIEFRDAAEIDSLSVDTAKEKPGPYKPEKIRYIISVPNNATIERIEIFLHALMTYHRLKVQGINLGAQEQVNGVNHVRRRLLRCSTNSRRTAYVGQYCGATVNSILQVQGIFESLITESQPHTLLPRDGG